MSGALDLVVVVVQAGDVGTGELGDLSRRPTNTAANIEHFHALREADAVRKVMLVSGRGLVEALANGVTAEVEGLAPAVLVEIRREIVVSVTY